MSNAPAVESDNVVFGGSALEVLRSPAMSLSAAAADQNPSPMAWGGELKRVYLVLKAAPDGAASAIRIGDEDAVDTYLSYSIATTDVPGVYDITDQLTTAAVASGKVLDFSTDGAATSAGSAALVVVLGKPDPSV